MPTTDIPGKPSQTKGACNSNPAVTNYWLNVLLGPFHAFISNIHHVLFLWGKMAQTWCIGWETILVLPYAGSCKPLYAILPNFVPCQRRTHVFTNTKFGKPVKRRTCDFRASPRFSMASQVIGRDFFKCFANTPGSAHKKVSLKKKINNKVLIFNCLQWVCKVHSVFFLGQQIHFTISCEKQTCPRTKVAGKKILEC